MKHQFKTVILLFTVIGAGVGGSATLAMSQLGSEQLLFLGGVIVPATIAVMFVFPTIIGTIVAVHNQQELPETGSDLYVMTAVSVFIGSIVFMGVTTVVLGLEVETGLDVQELLVPFAAAAAPAAVSSACVAWCID